MRRKTSQRRDEVFKVTGFSPATIPPRVRAAPWVDWTGFIGREQSLAEAKPNIVLMAMDNLGWGEIKVYGGRPPGK